MSKKILFLANLVLIVLGLCLNANAAIIGYEPFEDPITVSQNASFQIDIYAQEDFSYGDLTSYGFYVDALDSLSLVTFDGYTISNSDYTDLGMDNYIDGFKGSVNPNAGYNIFIATLYFTAGQVNGMDTIELEGLAAELDGLAYELGDADISASIHVNVVPIPGAIWLIGSGILALAGFRKYRRNY